MTLRTLAILLRAATKPRAGQTEGATVVRTNDDLERLLAKGLISVVGQVPGEATEAAAAPSLYVRTQDPEWYAEKHQSCGLSSKAERLNFSATVKRSKMQ